MPIRKPHEGWHDPRIALLKHNKVEPARSDSPTEYPGERINWTRKLHKNHSNDTGITAMTNNSRSGSSRPKSIRRNHSTGSSPSKPTHRRTHSTENGNIHSSSSNPSTTTATTADRPSKPLRVRSMPKESRKHPIPPRSRPPSPPKRVTSPRRHSEDPERHSNISKSSANADSGKERSKTLGKAHLRSKSREDRSSSSRTKGRPRRKRSAQGDGINKKRTIDLGMEDKGATFQRSSHTSTTESSDDLEPLNDGIRVTGINGNTATLDDGIRVIGETNGGNPAAVFNDGIRVTGEKNTASAVETSAEKFDDGIRVSSSMQESIRVTGESALYDSIRVTGTNNGCPERDGIRVTGIGSGCKKTSSDTGGIHVTGIDKLMDSIRVTGEEAIMDTNRVSGGDEKTSGQHRDGVMDGIRVMGANPPNARNSARASKKEGNHQGRGVQRKSRDGTNDKARVHAKSIRKGKGVQAKPRSGVKPRRTPPNTTTRPPVVHPAIVPSKEPKPPITNLRLNLKQQQQISALRLDPALENSMQKVEFNPPITTLSFDPNLDDNISCIRMDPALLRSIEKKPTTTRSGVEKKGPRSGNGKHQVETSKTQQGATSGRQKSEKRTIHKTDKTNISKKNEKSSIPKIEKPTIQKVDKSNNTQKTDKPVFQKRAKSNINVSEKQSTHKTSNPSSTTKHDKHERTTKARSEKHESHKNEDVKKHNSQECTKECDPVIDWVSDPDNVCAAPCKNDDYDDDDVESVTPEELRSKREAATSMNHDNVVSNSSEHDTAEENEKNLLLKGLSKALKGTARASHWPWTGGSAHKQQQQKGAQSNIGDIHEDQIYEEECHDFADETETYDSNEEESYEQAIDHLHGDNNEVSHAEDEYTDEKDYDHEHAEDGYDYEDDYEEDDDDEYSDYEFQPDDYDVCFDAPEHPGTVAFEQAVKQAYAEHGDVFFSRTIYKTIQDVLHGRDFYIWDDGDEEIAEGWREAEPLEIMDYVTKSFEFVKQSSKE